MDERDDTTYRVKVPWVYGKHCNTALTPVGVFMCGIGRDGFAWLTGGDSDKPQRFHSIEAAEAEALRILEAKLLPCLEIAQSVRFTTPEPQWVTMGDY